MATVYIEKESVDHIVLTNDTGAALAQYELTVIGGLVLVADEAIANGATGSFHVEENLVLQVNTFVAAEDTFGTANADVFWKPTTGEFSDTSTAGYYKVGIVQEVKDSSGVVKVLKARNAVAI